MKVLWSKGVTANHSIISQELTGNESNVENAHALEIVDGRLSPKIKNKNYIWQQCNAGTQTWNGDENGVINILSECWKKCWDIFGVSLTYSWAEACTSGGDLPL